VAFSVAACFTVQFKYGDGHILARMHVVRYASWYVVLILLTLCAYTPLFITLRRRISPIPHF
jgi:hypothetical protein